MAVPFHPTLVPDTRPRPAHPDVGSFGVLPAWWCVSLLGLVAAIALSSCAGAGILAWSTVRAYQAQKNLERQFEGLKPPTRPNW